MHCQEFEDRLHSLLDERRQPEGDSLLRRHARECEACRGLLIDQRLLLAALSNLKEPSLSPDFAQQVVQRADVLPLRTASADRPRMIFALGVLLTSAAAALLGVWLLAPQGDNSRAIAVRSNPAPADSDARASRDRGGKPGKTFASPMMFAVGRADWLIEAPRIHDHLDSIDNLAATLPQTVERFDEVERLAPGIKPLRASFSLIWDTLRRTIAGTSDEDGQHRDRTSLIEVLSPHVA